MSQDELTAIMAAKNEADLSINRKGWEQTRLICFYVMIAMNGSELKTKDGKIIKLETPADLIPLGWDEPKEEKLKAERLTKDEFLKEAEEIKKLINL